MPLNPETAQILQRYFSKEQVDQWLTVDGDRITTAGIEFSIDWGSGTLRLVHGNESFQVPDHLRADVERSTWEAIAYLKVRVLRSGEETRMLAETGMLYDEDYFKRRGGGSPYVGYPLNEGGFSESERFGILAKELLLEFGRCLVLDAGCATGELVRRINEQGLDGWGFDISPWAVEHSVSDQVIRSDARRIALPDNFADVVVSQDFLEHFTPDDLPLVLKELHRVSRSSAIHYHFVPFYEGLEEPSAIDAHLCNASRTWWLHFFENQNSYLVDRLPRVGNQWEYPEGILANYFRLSVVK